MRVVRRMKPEVLRGEIERVFLQRFDETLQLLEDLSAAQTNPRAIVMLASSVIDSLANLALPTGPQSSRFTTFVRTYSGRAAQLEKVAVPNLYREMTLKYVTLPLSIETPGRILLLDRAQDVNWARVLVASGLPITADRPPASWNTSAA